MRAVEIIEKKRDGERLSEEEIRWFVHGFTVGEIPDYQASALLMAIYLRGMSDEETTILTDAMVESGERLSLAEIAPRVVDKHSSGGVGDKTTLIVAPVVAALGLPVAKMSGRGLGFSGGTLDKLEAIPGFRSDLDFDRFMAQVREIGLVVAGASATLAPADAKLYALRDVTGTVSSLPLIASSIMSKKLAAGADAIVLDVKAGSGAFMPDPASAAALARLMVAIGAGMGREVTALLSDMSQPLGSAVGNALEVVEAIDCLRGGGPPDLREHCLVVAAHMLLLGGRAPTLDEARVLATEALDGGTALERFIAMVVAQGGERAAVEHPERLPRAPHQQAVKAPEAGVVAAMDAAEIGLVVVALGGGRSVKGQEIDPAVGVIMDVSIGDLVEPGQPLMVVHARTPEHATAAAARLQAALTLAPRGTTVERPPLFYDTLTTRASGPTP